MGRRKNLHPQHKVTAKSVENLKKGRKIDSAERARELGSKGGKVNALKFQTEQQLAEALIALLNKKIADKFDEEMTLWEGALNTAGKEGITSGRGAFEFIKLVMSLWAILHPKEQTINLVQTKDKATIAQELKIAQSIIKQLKK